MKIIGRLLLGGLLVLCMVLPVGCAAAPWPMEGEEDFIGFITEIHLPEGPGASGEIVVESHADKIVTRYVITVTDEPSSSGRKGMVSARRHSRVSRTSNG